MTVLAAVLANLIILVIAMLIDRLGEPPESVHPTVWMGKLARLIPLGSGISARVWGSVIALLIVLLFGSGVYVILQSVSLLGLLPYVALSAVLLKTTFALRTMDRFILPVADALRGGDIELARSRVQRVVRRETKDLPEELVMSAAIESVAEGTVDGVTAPLFFFALMGVPASMAYRAINTLDSTVGYKTEGYADVGWFSAMLDSLANYFPARLTAYLMIVSWRILGENNRGSLRMILKDRKSTESVNAGWPISAMAGALSVRLEKRGHYVIGSDMRQPLVNDVLRALQIMHLTSYLFILLIVLPISTAIAMLSVWLAIPAA